MNKNKKLIALISALAMIFSLFTSFAVVRAEGQGVKLVYDEKNSTETTTYLDVVAEGYASLESYTMVVSAFPNDITAAVKESALIGGEENFENGTFLYSAAASSAQNVPSDGVILRIKLTGKVTEDFNVQIGGTSTITGYDASGEKVKLTSKAGTLVSEAETVPVWTDPNATPTPTPEAPVSTKGPKVTPTPAPSDNPDETTAPLETPAPVEVTQGVVIETETENATTAYVTVKAVNYASLESYTMVLGTFPETVTAAVKESALIGGEENFENGSFLYSAAASSAQNVPADGVILKVKLTGTFDDDFVVSVGGTSTITGYDASGEKVKLTSKAGTLPAAWSVVEAYAAPEESAEPQATATPIPQVAEDVVVDDVVDKDTITDEKKDADGDSNYRLGIKVTDKDGNDVTDSAYGKDDGYVATVTDKDGNEVELTKAEYSNLVNGYISELPESLGITNMKDAISKLKLKPYNSGMNFTVQIIDEDDNVVSSGEESPEDIGGGNTTNPSAPKVTASNVSATVDTNFNISATVTNYTDKTNPKVTFEIVKDKKGTSYDGNNGSVINIYGKSDAATTSDDVAVTSKTVTQKFTANKTGTAYVKVSYVDDEGNKAETVVTVTVKAGGTTTDKNSGSSKSTSSGTGAIAHGDQTGTGSSLFNTFNDLGDVEWAQPAINTLAREGIVSGRGDGTFDPNANITRAEYCQMLVNTIESTGDYADANFADVPTDAWFYHAVAVAQNLGIVSGYDDGTYFGPYDLITREQMALMTQKAAQVKGVNLAAISAASFTDDAEIGDWAKNAVYELANAGIINGMGDGTFAPKANATRAQSAVIIYNTFMNN